MDYNDDIQSKVVDLYNTTSKSLSSLPSLSLTEYNNTELLYTKISNFSGSVLNSSSLSSSPLSSYLNDNDLSVHHNGTYYNPSNLAVTATSAAILIDENLIDRISTELLTSSSSSPSSVSSATTVATKFLSSSSTTLSAAAAASASTSSSSSLFANGIINQQPNNENDTNNYWALLALILVFGTAAGNILVCLAIAWERRLQNVTNYFLMSLAITDLMVAILVMPLGILTLVKGYFPLESEHCLVWICLDVLFCTASIMHLCTISVDRYLSLRYPMRFGRNKTRRRVTLKIVFVWLLSIAMSLPLSLMYSQDHSSVLVNGTCQIPDPVYKLVGSIVCFYIPLGVMLLTYCLTVRLLAQQRQNLGGTYNQTTSGWASGWLGQTPALERRCTWRRLLKANQSSTPNHAHSGTSTDTELSTLDTHELWLPDSSIPEPTPSTMTALHQFGAEMLKLSRGLESVGSVLSSSSDLVVSDQNTGRQDNDNDNNIHQRHQHFRESNIPSSIIRNANTKNTINNNDSLKNQQTMTNYYPKSLSTEQAKKTFGKKNIRQRSQSSSSFTRRFNALRKRRASTSSSSSPYENRPGTPPPIARKRFHSLPKNTLVLQNNNNSTSNDHETSTSTTSQIIIKDQSLSHSPSPNSNLISNEMNTVGNDNHFISENNVSEKICYDRNRHRVTTDDYLKLPPPCTCPYFGDRPLKSNVKPAEVKIISTSTFRSSSSSQESDLLVITSSSASETSTTITTLPNKSPTGLSSTYLLLPSTPTRKLSYSKTASVVTWDSGYIKRRGSSFGGVKTSLISTPTKIPLQNSPLRRSATLRNHNSVNALINNENSGSLKSNKTPSSPCILQRNATIRSHHSRNSSVISRNSSRHGRIIRLEQKATKVLGVVFFTFVILWAPFFVLNLVPSVCGRCEKNIAHWVFDVVTWLGYASSMVNPIFYTIFNKVFRQAFKKVLLCKYGSGSATSNWRPNR